MIDKILNWIEDNIIENNAIMISIAVIISAVILSYIFPNEWNQLSNSTNEYLQIKMLGILK